MSATSFSTNIFWRSQSAFPRSLALCSQLAYAVLLATLLLALVACCCALPFAPVQIGTAHLSSVPEQMLLRTQCQGATQPEALRFKQLQPI